MKGEESDKLDNFLKRKVKGNPYPLHEADAEKALAALAASRKATKASWLIPAIALILLSGIGLVSSALLQSNQTQLLENGTSATHQTLAKVETPSEQNSQQELISGNPEQARTSEVFAKPQAQPEVRLSIKSNQLQTKPKAATYTKEPNQSFNANDLALAIQEAEASSLSEAIEGEDKIETAPQYLLLPDMILLNSRSLALPSAKAIAIPGQKSIPPIRKHNNWTPHLALGLAASTNAYNEFAFQGQALVQFHPRGKVHFYTGASYSQTFGQLPSRTYVQNRYGFEKEETQIKLETRKLDYIGIPLGIGFDAGSRHQLSGGFRYLVLVNSRERETIRVNGHVVSVEQKTGFNQPFNQKDFLLELGYSYRIYPGIHLQAMAFRGTIPQSRTNNLETKNVFNQGWRLGLLWQVR
ncbi:MAG: hypothetical protein L6Q78_05930 [Bacteroidia bacterium]|nr:hypothetical protein [Bacteroidia bacterium]